MSATISWRALKPGKSLPVDAPSSFIQVFTEAFGEAPWTLNEEDIKTLKGIRAADRNTREGIDEIIEAIDRHGAIEVSVSY